MIQLLLTRFLEVAFLTLLVTWLVSRRQLGAFKSKIADKKVNPPQTASQGTPTKEKHGIVHINLRHMAGTGIIIPYSCGVVYSNQVGGYSCSHPSIEGVFIPLITGDFRSNDVKGCQLSMELYEYFFKGKWQGWCMQGIDEETANYLDDLFQKYPPTKYLRIDRTALEKSMEAWIYVTLNYPEERFPIISDSSLKTAVLTWPNSD